MIDKDRNIVPDTNIINKIMGILKENVSVIALFVPVALVIVSVAKDYLLYIKSYGYYAYFGIEARLMLPLEDKSFFVDISAIAIVVVYWMYSIFTVRMFTIKGNWVGKIITLVIIPYVGSSILMLNTIGFRDILTYLLSVGLTMIIQWLLIFSFGYCLVIEIHRDYRSKRNLRKKERKKTKKDFKKRSNLHKWKERDYRSLGILIMAIAVLLIIISFYSSSYRKGQNQKYFGVLEINEVFYAVIDANDERVVLQQCDIEAEKNLLIIYKDTYMCKDNEMLINYNQYDRVMLKNKTEKGN